MFLSLYREGKILWINIAIEIIAAFLACWFASIAIFYLEKAPFLPELLVPRIVVAPILATWCHKKLPKLPGWAWLYVFFYFYPAIRQVYMAPKFIFATPDYWGYIGELAPSLWVYPLVEAGFLVIFRYVSLYIPQRAIGLFSKREVIL